MKIIDILNKKANGTLEDGFKFIYDNEVYQYNKENDRLIEKDETSLGYYKNVDNILNDEVEVILRDEEIDKTKRIEQISSTIVVESENGKQRLLEELIHICKDKINELIQTVNKMNGV